MVSSASLDALSDDLVLEVLKYFDRKRDRAVPRCFRMLTSIARVNRRFRRLASPYLFNEVRVLSSKLLPGALFDRFAPHLSQIAYAARPFPFESIVNDNCSSIRVGHPPLRVLLSKNCPNLSFPTTLEYARLHILSRFDCIGCCFEPKELTEVFGASNSQLRSLRLGWDGGWLFPFDSFPMLEELFILIHARELRSYDPHPRVFPSLTSLSIVDNVMMDFFETKICGCATFPNLRTFRLQSCPTYRHNRLFGFISAHTTILDVDIPGLYVDFPTLIQLARGDTNSDWDVHLPVEAHRISPINIPSLSSMDRPDFVAWKNLELAGFSFIRATRSDGVFVPHTLTKLGLKMSFDDDFLFRDLGGLGEFSLLVECTELSLVIPDPDDEAETPATESLESMMRGLAEGLARWKNLRHLYLECPSAELDDHLIWLEISWPPFYDDFDFETHCEHWCEKVEKWRQFSIKDEMDSHDVDCFMQLWKATHEHEMAGCVRNLASACLTLEVFDWSIRSEQFYPAYPAHAVLWRWDIQRNTDGTVRLVSGHLTWNGIPTHPLHSNKTM